MIAFAHALGSWLMRLLRSQTDVLRVILDALGRLPGAVRERRPPVRQVYLKQVYFTGLESLKIVLPVSMALGTIIITQIVGLVGVGNESLTAKVLVWTVVRELGPLLTALIVIARSGAAIATELGSMKINREIEALEMLGIPPENYLILPRLVGVTTAIFALTVYFEIGAVAGGFAVASLAWHLPFEQFAQGIYTALTFSALFMSALKSVVFGMLISAACCAQGFSVGESATEIPQAATRGVMYSLFLVVIGDGCITGLAALF